MAPEPFAPAQEVEAVASQGVSPVQGSHDSVESLVDHVVENGLPVDITRAIHHMGDLKAMGLDYGWGTTATVESMLEFLYIDGGLGWGASIIASTVIIRLVLFPFQVMGSDHMAKMACIQPLVKDSAEDMKGAVSERNSDAILAARQKQSRIYKQFQVNPFKTMAPIFMQGVIGFGAFRCLRGMTTLPVPGFTESGWLWFQNLTIADPYYILPAITGGIMWYVMKVRICCSFRLLRPF